MTVLFPPLHVIRVSIYATKLERFIRSYRLKPAHIARESGYSRQHLLRVRLGLMEPTESCMRAVTIACRRLSRVRAATFQPGVNHDKARDLAA